MSNPAYRIDGPKDIQTKQLLFWPNNPRLKISDFKEVKYTAKELIDPQNQSKIFQLLRSNEHSVDSLIKSMTKSGFMREKAPIVMEIKAINKYLVLEGNRRLTAIRTLLANKTNTLSENKYNSLIGIPCWLFIHTSKKIPLSSAISRLVAEQHLKGQKAHTKIQQAHMLYNAYMGFLLEKYGKKSFSKETKIIKQTAAFFGLGYEEFELELAVVRFYKQLFNAGYELNHKIRERLTWIYKNPRHFKNNFGYQNDTFQLDSPGIERYYDIFIKKNCAVHSPALFKRLINLMRYGEPSHIEILRHDPSRLRQLEQEVLDENSDKRFLLELERINKKLRGLKLRDYKKSKAEDNLIESILFLVKSKLKNLQEMDIDEETERTVEVGRENPLDSRKPPSNIDEALLITHRFLSYEIEIVISEFPNGICLKDNLPRYLLNKWGIVCKGTPPEKFCQKVEQAVRIMIQNCEIKDCEAENGKLRLSVLPAVEKAKSEMTDESETAISSKNKPEIIHKKIIRSAEKIKRTVEYISCPICDVKLRKENESRHLRKIHQKFQAATYSSINKGKHKSSVKISKPKISIDSALKQIPKRSQTDQTKIFKSSKMLKGACKWCGAVGGCYCD